VVILSSGAYITINDLPDKLREKTMEHVITNNPIQIPSIPKEGLSLSSMVNEFEKAMILQALERSNWVKARAAKLLRLNRTTLIEKIKKQELSYTKVINE
jgi:DNA-binding NtrC family response regulator